MYLHNTIKLSEYQQEEINDYRQVFDKVEKCLTNYQKGCGEFSLIEILNIIKKAKGKE